jgi:hypothetical protein
VETRSGLCSAGQETAEHEPEDTAVADVLALPRRVQPHAASEAHRLAPVVRGGRDRYLPGVSLRQPLDGERLPAGQAERRRSKLSAIAARTPSNDGPFAAQSREEPEPYSFPASTISGTPSTR